MHSQLQWWNGWRSYVSWWVSSIYPVSHSSDINSQSLTPLYYTKSSCLKYASHMIGFSNKFGKTLSSHQKEDTRPWYLAPFPVQKSLNLMFTSITVFMPLWFVKYFAQMLFLQWFLISSLPKKAHCILKCRHKFRDTKARVTETKNNCMT